MADMMGNQTSVVSAPVTHRTYSDDGLSWPNRKSDFVGLLVPFLVCACRLPGIRSKLALTAIPFRFLRGPLLAFGSTHGSRS